MHLGQADRRIFPPLDRARVENLACSRPTEHGLELTHWSVRSLQTVAIRLEIVPTIHYTTIADILSTATLQPHHWRYWKTTVWNSSAVRQAAKVLRCYEHMAWLLEHRILVVCLDEKPSIQVLEHAGAIRAMIPDQIEQQEFEYIRHGTVNLLTAMTLHDGRIWAECLDANNGAHFRPAWQRYHETWREYVGIYLIGPRRMRGGYNTRVPRGFSTP